MTTLLLVTVAAGCDMIRIPLPEDDTSKPSTKQRSSKKNNSTRPLDLPMMQDSWFHVRPCQDPTGEKVCRGRDKCVRLESYRYPDHFLGRHFEDDQEEDNFPMLVRLQPTPFHPRQNSTFQADGSFCVQRNNLLDGRRAISLESVRSRGLYLTTWRDGGASHYEDVGDDRPPAGDNHLQLLELDDLEYYQELAQGLAWSFECKASYAGGTKDGKLRRHNNNKTEK